MKKPIIALATPPLNSALAIIRLSGENVIKYTERLLGKPIVFNDKNIIKHGLLTYKNKKLDDVVILGFKAPFSFTGEDVIEIISHGSMVIVQEIIDTYLELGVALARRGEFSLRAFLNNKVDLIQAEAINDLINAATIEGKDLALNSLKGVPSKRIHQLKEQLEYALARFEVNIDFPEYLHLKEIDLSEQSLVIQSLIKDLSKIYQSGKRQQIIKDGVRVALLGEPNVGKSTLLNTLLNKERAIVSDIPGTTRDFIEDGVIIDGIKFTFIDTAGIRETTDVIEKEGVKRTYASLKDVDLVIYLHEEKINKELPLPILTSKKPLIQVINKSDLLKEQDPRNIYISAINHDVRSLMSEVKRILHLSTKITDPVVNSLRGLELINHTIKALKKTLILIDRGEVLELIVIPLRQAYEAILELIGQKYQNDLGDAIFSRFCVGK